MLMVFQRQTVVSQFYQLDRLVVEGQKTVSLPDPRQSTIANDFPGQADRGRRRHSATDIRIMAALHLNNVL